MAHTYTRMHLNKPVVTLSLVAGGSLEPNTTYYYRAVTGTTSIVYRCDQLSAASDVKSITTDATNRSVKVDVAHDSGNPEYTWIWVAMDLDPGTGGWNDKSNQPTIVFLGNGTYTQYSTTRVPLDTFTDDGVSYGWYSTLYYLNGDGRVGGTSNYGYVLFSENAKDLLEINGGDAGAPITFDSINDYAIAQGWNPKETIDPIPLVDDFELQNRRGFILNFATVKLWGDSYFADEDKIIHLNVCRLQVWGEIHCGDYNSGLDLSSVGIDFILQGHGVQFGNVIFQSGSLVRLYDCRILVRRGDFSLSTPYTATFELNTTDWRLIDCTLTGHTEYGGLNGGLDIKRAAADGSCLLRRVSSNRGRYSGTITAADPFTIEGFVTTFSPTWVRHYGDVERVFRGVEIRGDSAQGGYGLTGSMAGDRQRTVVNFVDSYIYDPMKIYWYAIGGNYIYTSYYKFSYSVNIAVRDQSGAAIVGASVVLKNTNGDEEFSTTTDENGVIEEGLAAAMTAFPDWDGGVGNWQKADFLITYGPFTLTVEKEGFDTVILTAEIDAAADWEISLKHSAPVYVDRIFATVEDDLRATILDDTVRATILDDTVRATILDDTVRATILDSIE